MDELFGNLIYLIPIALVIVRVIAAAGNSKKKKPPSSPSARPAETPRRVPEQGMDPGMREFLRNFGVEAPPAPPAPKPRKKVVKEKPKKEPVSAAPLFAETQETPEQAGDPGKAVQTEPRGLLPVGLSPLQQGFLWAEILGPAKAMQDLRF
jgi:hypothetical protein